MALPPMPLLALLAASGVPGAAPPPVPVAPAEATASESQIDRFMAVLPDAERLNGTDAADAEELARLVRLNPGRETDIRPVLDAFAACSTPHNLAMSREGLRFAARRLGSAKLERLIRFYEGEDFQRFQALMARLSAGATPGPAEEAELNGFMAAYPLTDFYAVMRDEVPGFVLSQTETLAAIDRCQEAENAALERLGVDTTGPTLVPVPPPNQGPGSGE